jgi:hypothetical protein
MPADGFVANPKGELLGKIANYILGRVAGKPPTRGALPVPIVPSLDQRRRHLAVMAELKFRAEMKTLGLTSEEVSELWTLLAAGIQYAGDGFRAFSVHLQVKKLLEPGDRLALWSGGIEISQYARRLGYWCLETTVLGEMFDRIKLYNYERALWDLWDHLAKTFVEHVRHAGEIHVFVRNFDQKSTLLKVEYPRLLQLMHERRLRFKWHVIVGDGDTPDRLWALTPDGEPARETPDRQWTFDDRHAAEIALRAFLMREGRRFSNTERILKTNKFPRGEGRYHFPPGM